MAGRRIRQRRKNGLTCLFQASGKALPALTLYAGTREKRLPE